MKIDGLRGNIEERNHGKWRIRIDTLQNPHTKERRQFSCTIRGTREDAEAELKRLQPPRKRPLSPYYHPLAQLHGLDHTIAYLTAELAQLTGEREVLIAPWRALIKALQIAISNKQEAL